MTRRQRTLFDPDLVRAIGHPLRVEILEILNEQEASPNQLKDFLGIGLSHVAYHTRVLRDCNCIELIRTEQRRGAQEHFYRALPKSSIGHQLWRRVPRSLRGHVTLAALKIFVEKLLAALKAGTVDSQDDTPLSSMTIMLDAPGRKEAMNIVHGVLAQLTAVDKESRQRAGDAKPLIPHVMGLALFEAAPRPSSEG